MSSTVDKSVLQRAFATKISYFEAAKTTREEWVRNMEDLIEKEKYKVAHDDKMIEKRTESLENFKDAVDSMRESLKKHETQLAVVKAGGYPE